MVTVQTAAHRPATELASQLPVVHLMCICNYACLYAVLVVRVSTSVTVRAASQASTRIELTHLDFFPHRTFDLDKETLAQREATEDDDRRLSDPSDSPVMSLPSAAQTRSSFSVAGPASCCFIDVPSQQFYRRRVCLRLILCTATLNYGVRQQRRHVSDT